MERADHRIVASIGEPVVQPVPGPARRGLRVSATPSPHAKRNPKTRALASQLEVARRAMQACQSPVQRK
jgi:hypothetical protein